MGEQHGVEKYGLTADAIASHLAPVFSLGNGWLAAATGVGRQADVWGTLYALHLKVLNGDAETRARQVVADAVKRQTIVNEGAVRHVPKDFDASPISAWEKVAPGFERKAYQNGGY